MTSGTLDADGERSALRFLTAGSVDDGKSTLIGRLLFDSHAILADQMDALERRAAGGIIELSFLADGLEAEREQGITIDVAYRYFATRRRKFIIADAPGHEQYTRNMVTAAAGSDAAVVLVDVTKVDWRQAPVPLLAQTRRHALLAHLLRVPNLLFAINKLDTLGADARLAYDHLRVAIEAFAVEAGFQIAATVPVSALRGDNVTSPSSTWKWYAGPTLLQVLETLPSVQPEVPGPLLLPVQYVARQQDEATHQASRTLWGRIARGRVQAGDAVRVFPSGATARVAEVRRAGEVVSACEAGESAGVVLDRHLDVSRGDWLAAVGSNNDHTTRGVTRFSATLAWLDLEPAQLGRRYWVRHGHRWALARILAVRSRRDIHTLQQTAASELAANEIGEVEIEVQAALPIQAYADNRVGGALIVVDPSTNRTGGVLLAGDSRHTPRGVSS